MPISAAKIQLFADTGKKWNNFFLKNLFLSEIILIFALKEIK